MVLRLTRLTRLTLLTGLTGALAAGAAAGTVLLMQGCTAPKQEELTTPYTEEPKEKDLPYNKLLKGPFTSLRQDTFYTTYKEVGGKKEKLDDRLVSNGKGFVAYCEKDGFDQGYYLYNFYGHTSFFVMLKDRAYRVAMTSPGDDLLRATQMLAQSHVTKPLPGAPEVKKLGDKKIEEYECKGIAYTTDDGARHEDWFDKNGRLIEQTVEGKGMTISRHLRRINPNCETIMLRLPEGYTLQK